MLLLRQILILLSKISYKDSGGHPIMKRNAYATQKKGNYMLFKSLVLSCFMFIAGTVFAQQDTLFTTEEKEILYFVEQLQKVEQQITELQKTKEQIIGTLTYIQQKYQINLQELIKRVEKK